MRRRLASALATVLVAAGVAASVVQLGVSTASAAAADQYSWRNVQIAGGGYVPGIVFNQTQPNLIYARTDIGGAYRWDQTSGRWVPLLDWVGWGNWGWNGVVSLATDPVDPNRLYVAAGMYTNSWDPNNGAILRSTDQRTTWQSSPLPFKLGGNMPGRGMGERLAIDPNRNSILYLGAPSGNGLWRSTDFGVTWSRVTNFPNPGTYVQDPNDPNGYLTDNQGVVWVTLDKRTGFLYIATSNKGGPYDGEKGDVWRYTTATGAWTQVSPVPSSSSDDYFGYSGLTIDRQHPGTIMVAAQISWWPDAIFFRSANSGATWTRIWDWTSYPNRSFRYTQDISAAPWLTFGSNPAPPEVTPKLGWMTSALEIDPFNSNRMLYGTGATIYGTTNLTNWDAGTQITIRPTVAGLEETAVLDLISPPSGAPLLSGLGDIGGFRHLNLDAVPSLMYQSPFFVSTTSLDYAELNPSVMVRVGNVDKTANPGVNRVGFSTDGGGNWFQGSEPGGVSSGGTVAAAADGSRFVWSPQGAPVQVAAGFGSSWTQSAGIPAGAVVESDRVNPSKFYGFSGGRLYVSSNGGASFTASAATGLPSSGNVSFKAVPGREGDIWLAGGSGASYGLWHSTNSGASFTRLSNVQEADNIGFGKAAPDQTYMALYTIAKIDNVRGIFRSDDAGATWVRINDDQHHRHDRPHHLHHQPATRRLPHRLRGPVAVARRLHRHPHHHQHQRHHHHRLDPDLQLPRHPTHHQPVERHLEPSRPGRDHQRQRRLEPGHPGRGPVQLRLPGHLQRQQHQPDRLRPERDELHGRVGHGQPLGSRVRGRAGHV